MGIFCRRSTYTYVAGEFHVSTFPTLVLSRFHRCIAESHRLQRASQSVLRGALGPDDAPRFGLCALRSRISRYTYATRDLLPMIMRGWKYALQEDEEEEEREREREAKRVEERGG